MVMGNVASDLPRFHLTGQFMHHHHHQPASFHRHFHYFCVSSVQSRCKRSTNSLSYLKIKHFHLKFICFIYPSALTANNQLREHGNRRALRGKE